MLTGSAASVTPVPVPVTPVPVKESSGGGSRLTTGVKQPKPGCEEVDIETRVQLLEDRWQELNALPTNSEMFRRLRKFREAEEAELADAGSNAGSNVDNRVPGVAQQGLHRTCHPMSELWHSMQLLNQVETNTEGITRVRTS